MSKRFLSRHSIGSSVIRPALAMAILAQLLACSPISKSNEEVSPSLTPNKIESSATSTNPETKPPSPSPQHATADDINTVVTANNEFAIDFLKQVSDEQEKNIFFSPYSLSIAMAMLYASAEGDTQRQIKTVFHYPESTVLNASNYALMQRLNQKNDVYDLVTANDLWLTDARQANAEFVDTIKTYYGGQVHSVDFMRQFEAVRQRINADISDTTEQMIPELLPKGSLSSDTSTVLTNAIYFKGKWLEPFTLKDKPEPFYLANGSAVQVPMMMDSKFYPYFENEHLQMVTLPYQGDALSMLILLPKENTASSMTDLAQQLSADQLNEWRDGLMNEEVNLTLPKFKLEEKYKLSDILATMGMPIAFTDKAELALYDDEWVDKIDEVYHQAVIEVDEEGTKAAAATGIEVIAVSAPLEPPKEFNANHPFLFAIQDDATGAILFMGQVNQPS